MSKQRGFTLIELLIVMVIISIVAGIAAITINRNQIHQYEAFAKQLANTLLLAEQEAMLRPAIIGVAFTQESIQFYLLKSDRKNHKISWLPLQQSAFKPYRIKDNMQVTLQINGKTVTAEDQQKMIITADDLQPFVILIGKKDETPYYRITGKANGEITSEAFHTE